MALPLPGPGSAAVQLAWGRVRLASRSDVLLASAGPAALTGALLIATSVPDLLQRVATPVAVVAILIGVPHGAVDHLVPFWLSGRRPHVRALVPVLLRYLLVASLAAMSFLALPDLAFAAFLAASVVHFGRADVQFGAERAGVMHREQQWLPTLAHGMTVVVLPFAVWPDRVAAAIDPLAPGLTSPALQPVWTALGALTCALALVSVGCHLRADRLREPAESALLLVAVLAVPPLVCFAVYFGAWHALRHTGRLLALPGPGGRPLDTRAALRRYAGQAAAPTVVVAAAAVVLVDHGSASVLTVAVAVVVALTFPHMRTVAEWDRQVRRVHCPVDESEPR